MHLAELPMMAFLLNITQSLLSTYLYISLSLIPTSLRRRRSIPYSSGLSFRSSSKLMLIIIIGLASQSLIHQVSVSESFLERGGLKNKIGLNPLFIRSQFQRMMIGVLGACGDKGLNPLFIRSQFQRKENSAY
jgi:hypothetical protein